MNNQLIALSQCSAEGMQQFQRKADQRGITACSATPTKLPQACSQWCKLRWKHVRPIHSQQMEGCYDGTPANEQKKCMRRRVPIQGQSTNGIAALTLGRTGCVALRSINVNNCNLMR